MIYARELLKHTFIGVLTTCLILDYCLSPAQDLCDERSYEPVVVQGDLLSHFFGIPVNEIVMYSYDGDTQSWRMIPFQIDEKTYGIDPYNPPRNRWFYFIPEEWNIDSHDNGLSDHDELVFMLRDLGDRAPENAWIDNDEAKSHARMELVASDPDDPDNKAYGYLYRSSIITDETPTPYDFEYNPEEDKVATIYYDVGFSEYGLMDDILIKEPWGDGQDIFDTQKLRFGGILDFYIPFEVDLTEEYFFVYDIIVTQKPVVRLIRRAHQILKFGDFQADDTPFFISAKFYPFNGNISAGTSTSSENLTLYYQNTEIAIFINSMRQSWDYNSNAEGMTFSNKYNEDILIDGIPDSVDHTVDMPISEWSLISGLPGSVFTFIELHETNWDNIELYYHDNLLGGQADDALHINQDTGDQKSYGDNGILFHSSLQDSLDLNFNLNTYFIPETNLAKENGEMLAHILRNPVQLTSNLKSDVKDIGHIHNPFELKLFQNHPNPFNNSTVISFILPQTVQIQVQIIDTTGRIVRTIVDGIFEAGRHRLLWDGRNNQMKKVASGIYFYQLSSEQYRQTKKLIQVQ